LNDLPGGFSPCADIVTIFVNHLMAEMAAAVESAGGYYSNFTGDGMMALFGLRSSPDHGARAALRCAAEMLGRLETVNHRLATHLSVPLRIGIGIHSGAAIVGRMGPPAHPLLTAIGDNVNVSSRLQELCKETNAPVMVSAATLAAITSTLPVLNWHETIVRGPVASLRVAAMDLGSLQALIQTAVTPASSPALPAGS
jgi:adenylate cyclase